MRRLSRVSAAVVTTGLVLSIADPALAQTGGSQSSTLADIIIEALEGFLTATFQPVADLIETQGSALLETIVETPHPDAVLDPPTNGAWPQLYTYYWGAIVPLSLSLYGLSLGLVILLETTSHLFSSYHRTKLKRRAFTALLGVLSWWWIAALSLRLADALTGVLLPSLSEISLFETVSISALGVLGLALSLSVDLGLFVLLGLIYAVRQLVLYMFVLLMPILIVLWVPGVGPFALLSRFVRRLAGFYVPFLLMTVPVAILFRLGEILGDSFGLSVGGIGAWLTALVIPFVAVLAPLVLVWQAGAIFFIGDRISRRVSTRQAQSRIADARTVTRETAHGGRNFVRGVRGQPAIQRSGQTLLGSGSSRAHATGRDLRRAPSDLESMLDPRPRSSVDSDRGQAEMGSGSRTGSTDARGARSENRSRTETETTASRRSISDSIPSDSSIPPDSSEPEPPSESRSTGSERTDDFRNLRSRDSGRPRRPDSDDDDDEPPPYLN
jgi:hypothetical protein